jgi:hypothetical protein
VDAGRRNNGCLPQRAPGVWLAVSSGVYTYAQGENDYRKFFKVKTGRFFEKKMVFSEECDILK